MNWDEVRNDLISAGAHDVILVRAKKSIEDWFLYDSDSIVSFLRLKKGGKITGSNGYDKLKRLYKKANKMYFKGMQSNGMHGIIFILILQSNICCLLRRNSR